MAHIILIACASKKGAAGAPARDLYQSPLFLKCLAYAETLGPDAIFILSAKHGLVRDDSWVEPYDESLNEKNAVEIRDWALRVLRDLARVADLHEDRFTILAGDKYRRYLVTSLAHVVVPLEGLGIGQQLQRLDELCRRR